MVPTVMNDYREALLATADRAMLDYAVKLTRTPGEMSEGDLAPLREQGFSDVAILEIVQVTALFNYYNRIADGLGIELEPQQ